MKKLDDNMFTTRNMGQDGYAFSVLTISPSKVPLRTLQLDWIRCILSDQVPAWSTHPTPRP